MIALERMSAALAKMRFHCRVFQLDIGREELVLDLGAGSSPHHRADVLCDISLSDDRERGGPVRLDRPCVVGDAAALPFRDGAFDFIICSHLLEHVRRPEACLREMMRVGRRGYIECPSEFAEKLCGWPPHRWFVRRENGRLIFTEKARPTFDDTISSGIWKAWNEKDSAYHLFFWRNPELFFTSYSWQGEIRYRIETAAQVAEELFVDAAPGAGETGLKRAPRGWNRFDPGWENLLRHLALSVLSLRRRRAVDLAELIACPECKSGLEKTGDKLICRHCGKWFPVWQGVPILLGSEANPL